MTPQALKFDSGPELVPPGASFRVVACDARGPFRGGHFEIEDDAVASAVVISNLRVDRRSMLINAINVPGSAFMRQVNWPLWWDRVDKDVEHAVSGINISAMPLRFRATLHPADDIDAPCPDIIGAILGFDSGGSLLPAGGGFSLISRPQERFRLDQLLISDREIAAFTLIEGVRVGSRDYLPRATPGLEFLRGRPIDGALSGQPTVQVGQDVVIIGVNRAGCAIRFRAAALGYARIGSDRCASCGASIWAEKRDLS